MKTILVVLVSVLFSLPAVANADEAEPTITPVSHASFTMELGGVGFVVDPVGDAKSYKAVSPDIILITHIHKDHLSLEVIASLKGEGTVVVGPATVVEKLGYGKVIGNGEGVTAKGISIKAIPAYNTTEGRLNYHPKGRDNGYVLTSGETTVYISGDTEDTPEMRALREIDYAFICMNLPYTMEVDQAASAVLEFKPRVVIPYHYRGAEGMSDIGEFERLVATDKEREVRKLEWYR